MPDNNTDVVCGARAPQNSGYAAGLVCDFRPGHDGHHTAHDAFGDHIAMWPQTGLLQSEHGGLHPELRARVSNAIDALYDFRQSERRYHDNHPDPEIPRPDYQAWAHRLNAALQGLITAIERNT